MKSFDLRTGTRILEVADSPINGQIRVVQSLAWGNHVQVGSLTQSGGVVFDIWNVVLKKVSEKHATHDCLILGLGGGSNARIVRRIWPDAKITGVEIDPVMVDMGMKYLGLSNFKVDIRIEDAYDFCKARIAEGKKYDMVLVDMYVGEEIPEKLESEEFVKMVKDLMEKGAVAVFNRTYYDRKRGEALIFGKKLGRVFSEVTPIYPEANVMYVCRI